MKKRNKVLKHLSLDESYPKVSPVKKVIPDWYKRGERFGPGIKEIKRFPAETGFKICSAFGDAFTTGYIMPLAVDLAIEQTEAGPTVSWRDEVQEFVALRDKDKNPGLPVPMGCSPLHFVWVTKHLFRIPKGYSALFTHPLNRFDLPFTTLSGIVDGEIALHSGNFPVYFSSTFEGIIPAGTPIAQIILFKTEDWNSEEDSTLLADALLTNKLSVNKAYGWYKQNIWKKKSYN